MNIRTDLALEAHELAQVDGSSLEGVKTAQANYGCLSGDLVEILNEAGEKATGKAAGKYVSLDVGRPWQDDTELFCQKAQGLAQALREVMGEVCAGQILVAGLGNRFITADAIGPLTVEHLIVTKHIKEEKPGLFTSLGLGEVTAIAPGVLGQTGIESAQILRSLARSLSPKLIVAVDALAARKISRLVTTVQLSDNGFAPGSGVGNRRMSVDEDTMGCPVVTVGVPTVVDAATLAYDAALAAGAQVDEEALSRSLEHRGMNFFVTPKESDSIMKNMGRLIGYGLNLALHPGLEVDAMISLAAC